MTQQKPYTPALCGRMAAVICHQSELGQSAQIQGVAS